MKKTIVAMLAFTSAFMADADVGTTTYIQAGEPIPADSGDNTIRIQIDKNSSSASTTYDNPAYLSGDTEIGLLVIKSGGVIDLSGHNLFCKDTGATGDKINISMITNSSATAATVTIKTSGKNNLTTFFKEVRFGGNLTLVVSNAYATGNYGFQGVHSTHVGGTILDHYYGSDDAPPRFTTSDAFGSGTLTLRNGTQLHFTGDSTSVGASELTGLDIVVDKGTNYWKQDNMPIKPNSLSVASDAVLNFSGNNSFNLSNTDVSGFNGTMIVDSDKNNFLPSTGLPNANILVNKTSGQLRYSGSDTSTDLVVSSLGTTESISSVVDYKIMHVGANSSSFKTIRVGNSDNTTFYGQIVDDNGGDWNVVKVGSGTWTLGGSNYYKGTTEIREGAIRLLKAAELGHSTSGGNINFTGGEFVFAEALDHDPSGRFKAAETIVAKIGVDEGQTVKPIDLRGLTGGLEKTREGTLELVPTALPSGNIDISAGTIAIQENWTLSQTLSGTGTLRVKNCTLGTSGKHWENFRGTVELVNATWEWPGNMGLPQNTTDAFDLNIPEGSAATIKHTNTETSGFYGDITGSGVLNITSTATNGKTVRLRGNTSAFAGTVNWFASSHGSASGLLGSTGSALADWNINTGTDTKYLPVMMLEASDNTVFKFGTLNLTNENAFINSNNSHIYEIGEKGGDSVVNGGLSTHDDNKTITVRKVGSGKLTLGPDFEVVVKTSYTSAELDGAKTITRALQVNEGEVELNADFDGAVTVAEDATLTVAKGKTLKAVAAAGTIAVDVSDWDDYTVSKELFTVTDKSDIVGNVRLVGVRDGYTTTVAMDNASGIVSVSATANGVVWTGSGNDGKWSTSGNWSNNVVPTETDNVIFDGDASVAVSDNDAVIDKLYLNGALTLSYSGDEGNGYRGLHVKGLEGNGKIVLSNGRISTVSGVAVTCSLPIEVVGDASITNWITGLSAFWTQTGSISGSGIVNFRGWSGNAGVKIAGDNSGFTGTGIIDSDSSNQTCFTAPDAASSTADWIYTGTKTTNRIFFDPEATDVIEFGSLNQTKFFSCSFRVNLSRSSSVVAVKIGGNNKDSVVMGGWGDENNTSERPNSYSKIVKVGSGTLSLYAPWHRCGTEINDGAVEVIGPDAISGKKGQASISPISFNGGTLVYGNDSTTSSETITPVTTDWSAQVVNSTEAIKVSTPYADVTWDTALAASNVKPEIVKSGSYNLTLTKEPAWSGTTKVTVEKGGGYLLVPTGTDVTLGERTKKIKTAGVYDYYGRRQSVMIVVR